MNPLDFDILIHLQKHPESTTATIISKFGTSAEVRLQHLLSLEAIKHNGYWDYNGEFQDSGTYKVTATGQTLLEDYVYVHSKMQKDKWEDRLWKLAPIVISTIALIKSFSSELFSIWKTLQSLLQ